MKTKARLGDLLTAKKNNMSDEEPTDMDKDGAIEDEVSQLDKEESIED